jgi:hypothetical protein
MAAVVKEEEEEEQEKQQEEEEKQEERQAAARQRVKATGKNGTRAPRSACCWRRSATVRPTTCARCTGTAASGVAS